MEVNPLYSMTESEEKLAELIWTHEPLGSGDLVRLCGDSLNWKKSTTYTVLKKLCDQGLFQNKQAVVTSLVDRQGYHASQSVDFVEDRFGGSLPRFLTAFISGKKLSRAQAEKLKRLIDAHREEEK